MPDSNGKVKVKKCELLTYNLNREEYEDNEDMKDILRKGNNVYVHGNTITNNILRSSLEYIGNKMNISME